MLLAINLITPLRRTLPLLLTGMLLGCATTFTSPLYSISPANVAVIRSAATSIELGEFSANQSSPSCRLQPIPEEPGKTIAQYLRAAFMDELVIAGTAPTKPKKRLSVKVVNIDVDCNSTDSHWIIELDVAVDNEPPFRVKTVKKFEYSFGGANIIPRAQQALVLAVQDTIASVLTHLNGTPARAQ